MSLSYVPINVVVFLSASLLSGTTGCRLVLHISCFSHRSSHFCKEPLFPLLKNAIRNRVENVFNGFFISRSSLWVLFIFHVCFLIAIMFFFLYILEQIECLCNNCFSSCIMRSLLLWLVGICTIYTMCGLWELLCLLRPSISSPCLWKLCGICAQISKQSKPWGDPSSALFVHLSSPFLGHLDFCSLHQWDHGLSLSSLYLMQLGNWLQAVNRDISELTVLIPNLSRIITLWCHLSSISKSFLHVFCLIFFLLFVTD